MASADTPRSAPVQPGRPGETLDYQPVAPAAVLAMAVAGLFTLSVAVLVVVGLTSRKPVIVWELLVVAFLGVCLSIVGRLQVRNSEGTRTGMGLTVVAWWLSIAGGVGYGAYIAAMEQSIRREGQQFARDWLEELKKPDQNVAFVMTLDPAKRAAITPSDENQLKLEGGGQPLASFRTNEFTKMFLRLGGVLRYEFVGVRDWKPNKTGYEMAQTWKIVSPEGTIDVVLNLIAVDNKNTVSRQWLIMPPGEAGFLNPRRTPWGRAGLELMTEAAALGRNWGVAFGTRQDEAALQTMLPASERVDPAPARNARQSVGGGLVGLIQPASFPKELVDGFLKVTGQPDPETLTRRRAQLRRIFEKHTILPAGSVSRGSGSDMAPSMVEVGDEILFAVPMELLSPDTTSRVSFARGSLLIRSENPEFNAWLKDLQAKARANPETFDTSTTSILASAPERRFRIYRLDTDMEFFSPIAVGGGPGVPGGPGGGPGGPGGGPGGPGGGPEGK